MKSKNKSYSSIKNEFIKYTNDDWKSGPWEKLEAAVNDIDCDLEIQEEVIKKIGNIATQLRGYDYTLKKTNALYDSLPTQKNEVIKFKEMYELVSQIAKTMNHIKKTLEEELYILLGTFNNMNSHLKSIILNIVEINRSRNINKNK